MKAPIISAALLSLALAGCASTRSGPGPSSAEVTRFHLGQEIARGPIAIEAFDKEDANSIEFRGYAAAVSRELTRLGWTVVDTVGQSEQVAMLGVRQGSRVGPPQRSPVTIGIGGGTGGYGGGVGVGASFGVGGERGGSEIVGTSIEVSIRRRSDGTVFWEGRGRDETRAGRDGDIGPVADRLTAALFQDFPGESGRTITLR